MVQQINSAAMGGTSSPKEAVAASKRYGNFLGMELGFSYDSAAVVPDGSQPPKVEDERSEEHTSELQSLMRISYSVFCLTKKKEDEVTLLWQLEQVIKR